MTLLTVKQAAELIHRRPQYVRDMIRDGRITAHRLKDKGPWLVEAESIDRLFFVRPNSTSASALLRQDEAILKQLGWE